MAKNLPVSSNFGCLLDTDGQSEKLYSQAAAQAVNFLLTYAVQPAEEFSPWQTESEPSGTKIDVRCRKLAEELQYVLCTAFDNNQSELEKSLAEALKNRGPIIRLLQQEAEAEGLEYSCRDYSAFGADYEHLIPAVLQEVGRKTVQSAFGAGKALLSGREGFENLK